MELAESDSATTTSAAILRECSNLRKASTSGRRAQPFAAMKIDSPKPVRWCSA
jgi:hypothetical protein